MTLKQLKERMDSGEYRERYMKIKVDNDAVIAWVYADPDPDWENDPEPIGRFSLNFGMVMIVEALTLLGFNAEQV